MSICPDLAKAVTPQLLGRLAPFQALYKPSWPVDVYSKVICLSGIPIFCRCCNWTNTGLIWTISGSMDPSQPHKYAMARSSSTDSDNGLVSIRWQAIIWTNDGLVYGHIYASMGFNLLSANSSPSYSLKRWVNSLWPSDTMCDQRHVSSLAMIFANCSAPSHHLNQYWNFNQNTFFFIQVNDIETVVCQMWSILFV